MTRFSWTMVFVIFLVSVLIGALIFTLWGFAIIVGILAFGGLAVAAASEGLRGFPRPPDPPAPGVVEDALEIEPEQCSRCGRPYASDCCAAGPPAWRRRPDPTTVLASTEPRLRKSKLPGIAVTLFEKELELELQKEAHEAETKRISYSAETVRVDAKKGSV